MYLPSAFAMSDEAEMRALIRERPLATIVTKGIVSMAMDGGGLDAEHVPMLLRPSSGDVASPGVLVGHVAKGNPLAAAGTEGVPALAIFHGPEAYVTPSWYPTKRETGKAVPTWNYAVVHVHGRLRAIDAPVWLREQVAEITRSREETRNEPWSLDDAPADYVEAMLRGIVGLEMVVTRMIGKSKMSQNQPERNRAGVVEGLTLEAGDADADPRQTVARLVENGGGLAD